MGLKIHGLMRTGTNFLEFLMYHNFGVKVIADQVTRPPELWKHSFLNDTIKYDAIITYKHIFPWLRSLYKFSHIKGFKDFFDFGGAAPVNMKEFIRRKFTYKEFNLNTFARNGSRVFNAHQSYPDEVTLNPIILWNKMNHSWLSSKFSGKKIFIDYEDLIVDTWPYLMKIGAILNLKVKSKNYIYPENDIWPNESFKWPQVIMSPGNEKNNSVNIFYNNKEYMNFFDPDDVDFVNSHVDKNLTAELDSIKLLP